MIRFKIKNNVNVTDMTQRMIAKRLMIEPATLNKILLGKALCTKATAWYITYLHLRATNQPTNDELIYQYFEEVE